MINLFFFICVSDDEGKEHNIQENSNLTDEEIEQRIDELLRLLDKNVDGYIDWVEYQVQELQS